MIKQNDLKVERLFNNFDKDKSGMLDFAELGKFIKLIAPRIRVDELEKVLLFKS